MGWKGRAWVEKDIREESRWGFMRLAGGSELGSGSRRQGVCAVSRGKVSVGSGGRQPLQGSRRRGRLAADR